MATEPQVTDFTAENSNPLYNYRAPRKLPKKHARINAAGTHFIPEMEEVVNDTSMISIYPSYFRLRANPHQEIEFKLWEDRQKNVSPESIKYAKRDYQNMTMRDHFRVALAKEFDINERVKEWWKKDIGGRITFGGESENATVLMWRTGEEADAAEKKKLRLSDSIQQSVEQKMAASAADLSTAAGMEVSASVTIEEEEK